VSDPAAPSASAVLFRYFVVRASPADLVPLTVDIQRMLRDVLPPGWSLGVRPWNERYQELRRTQSFLSGLFAGFGVVALLLCAIGLYSVLSYAVSQRMREYGIRIAIGATPRDIFRTVLGDGAVLVLGGTALGGFASIWTNKLVDRYILYYYHIDAIALAIAEALLLVVALAAVTAPAVWATRSNPVDVLRAV
jgi:ABC-type antimicrobial peptide transport system permease subunit